MEKIKVSDIKKGDKIRVGIGEVDWFFYTAIEYVARADGENYIISHINEVEFFLLDRPKKPFVLKEGMVIQHPDDTMYAGVYINDSDGGFGWLAYDDEEPEKHWQFPDWGESKYAAGWIVTYEGRDA